MQPYASDVPDGDLLVVLSHVGLSLDRELAARVPRIDLILGGHSHDTLDRPEYVGAVPIVHAGPYGRYVSRSELEYDAPSAAFRVSRASRSCRCSAIVPRESRPLRHATVTARRRSPIASPSSFTGSRPMRVLDHLALVGERPLGEMREVGPRRTMPSGGLIAMGNVRNLARDLRAGLIALTWNQARFLRNARGEYDAAVAVGDVYALADGVAGAIADRLRRNREERRVAPYGRFEARVLRTRRSLLRSRRADRASATAARCKGGAPLT